MSDVLEARSVFSDDGPTQAMGARVNAKNNHEIFANSSSESSKSA